MKENVELKVNEEISGLGRMECQKLVPLEMPIRRLCQE
jgi:hypothetical protein